MGKVTKLAMLCIFMLERKPQGHYLFPFKVTVLWNQMNIHARARKMCMDLHTNVHTYAHRKLKHKNSKNYRPCNLVDKMRPKFSKALFDYFE